MHLRAERGRSLDRCLHVRSRSRRRAVRGLGGHRLVACRRGRRRFVGGRGCRRRNVNRGLRGKRRRFDGRRWRDLTRPQHFRGWRGGCRRCSRRHLGRRSHFAVGHRAQLPRDADRQCDRCSHAGSERPATATRGHGPVRGGGACLRRRCARSVSRRPQDRRVQRGRRRSGTAVACQAVGQQAFFRCQRFAVGSVHGLSSVRSLSIA